MSGRTIRVSPYIAAFVFVALLFSACTTGGQQSQREPEGQDADGSIELTMASPIGPDTHGGQSLEWWSAEVEERTDGRVSAEIFHNATLLEGTETMPGTGDGRTDIGFTFSVYHPDQMPLWNIANVPFLTRDAVAVADALTELYEQDETFRSEIEKLNIVPLFFVPHGSTAIGLTEPVDDHQDLAGKRLRATGYIAELLDSINADSTFIEFGELYEAMQRGVVDGWAGSEMTGIAAAGLAEVTPYFVDPGIGIFSSAAAFINRDVWEGLPEDIRGTVEEVSAEYREWIAREKNEIESNACERILADGATVDIWEEDTVREFESAVGGVVEESLRRDASAHGVSSDQFDALLEDYTDAVSSFEGETAYKPGLEECAASDE